MTPLIDTTDTFKAQKDTKSIVKIIHVTSAVGFLKLIATCVESLHGCYDKCSAKWQGFCNMRLIKCNLFDYFHY